MKITKIMKIFNFCKIIKKIMKILKFQRDSLELLKVENLKISCENLKIMTILKFVAIIIQTYDNCRNPRENNEIHENRRT